jgi:NTE family protein
MNDTPGSSLSARRERALVLGGGGGTGNAWLIGVLAGLGDEGLDVTTADLTIGTSAGSTAAAQVAGATPGELLAAILAAAPAPPPSRPGPARPVVDHLGRMRALIASSEGAADYRRRICAAAIARADAADASWQEAWRATVAARLPGADWPERALVITAVDAGSAEPVLLDRRSGVALVDAVAASCSSGLPYRIGDRRYLDGGFRSNAENADLAAGYERVLVLAPFGGRSFAPASWGTHLATQLDGLRAGGSRVELIVPDEAAEPMFGANAMDPALRAPAAQAGHDQGRELAGTIGELWR